MNKLTWSDAFAIKAEELLDLEPIKDVLYDGQERSITIHSMYGNFACRKCMKSWSSTMCCTELLYKYEFGLKQGEIKIKKEYKQDCNKCKIPAEPKFDEEATMRAMKIVIDRIKKIFYVIYPEEVVKDSADSDKHSRARERKNNHDSKNCEACRLGKCTYGDDFLGGLPKGGRGRGRNPLFDRARTNPIKWALIYAGQCETQEKEEDDFDNDHDYYDEVHEEENYEDALDLVEEDFYDTDVGLRIWLLNNLSLI